MQLYQRKGTDKWIKWLTRCRVKREYSEAVWRPRMRKWLSIKHGFIKIQNLVLDLGQIHLNVMANAQSSGLEQEKVHR